VLLFECVEDGGAWLIFIVVDVDTQHVGGHAESDVAAGVVFDPGLNVGTGGPCSVAAGPPVGG
jgi:hypothetical protein